MTKFGQGVRSQGILPYCIPESQYKNILSRIIYDLLNLTIKMFQFTADVFQTLFFYGAVAPSIIATVCLSCHAQGCQPQKVLNYKKKCFQNTFEYISQFPKYNCQRISSDFMQVLFKCICLCQLSIANCHCYCQFQRSMTPLSGMSS